MRSLQAGGGWFPPAGLLLAAGLGLALGLCYGAATPAQGALAVALAVAVAWAWLQARGLLAPAAGAAPPLVATRTHPPRVFEDDLLEITLTLRRGAGPPLQMLLLEDQCLASLEPRRRELIPELASGWQVRLRYTRQADRHHGLYLLGPLNVLAADAFGLFPVQRELPVLTRVTVYPHAEALPGYQVPGPVPPAGPSLEAVARLGLGEEVLGIREYRHGDPPARIHWRSSARRGALHTIQLDRPVQSELALYVDLTRLARYGLGAESTARIATQAATTILTRAWQGRHRFSLAWLREELTAWPAGQGLAHLHLLLDKLVVLEPAGQGDFWAAVAPLATALGPGSRAVFVVVAARAPADQVLPLIRGLGARGVACDLILIDERAFVRIYREQERDRRQAATTDPAHLALLARQAGARVYLLRRGADALAPPVAAGG